MAFPALKQGRKVALVGASGNIGKPTLSALLSQNIHTLTVIQRLESTASYHFSVIVRQGRLDDEDFLAEVMHGLDVLVLQLTRTATDIRPGLIGAAARAGIKYVLPVEFGTAPGAQVINEFDHLVEKREARRLIEELGISSWIAVVTNPWLEIGAMPGSWGINVKKRKVTLWDGGRSRINTSTLKRSGEATAELLSLPDAKLEQFRNRCFYVSSFFVSQRDLFESVLRATNTDEEDWEVTTLSVEDVLDKSEKALKAGDFMGSFLDKYYMTHFRIGFGGDYNDRVNSDKMGLSREDLDTVIAESLQSTV